MRHSNYFKLESQIKKFVSSGFKKSKFTVAIYEALYVDSGRFIAHTNRDKFYEIQFSTPARIRGTMDALTFIKPINGKYFDSYETKKLLRSIPELYQTHQKTWAMGETCFPYIDGRCSVVFKPSEKWECATVMFNMDAYISKSIGFITCILQNTHAPILVNSDSIAYDWILNLPDKGTRVDKDRLIILVNTGSDYKTNGGYIGASELRLKKAQAKLKSLGYKTKYCKTLKEAKQYVETIKIYKEI